MDGDSYTCTPAGGCTGSSWVTYDAAGNRVDVPFQLVDGLIYTAYGQGDCAQLAVDRKTGEVRIRTISCDGVTITDYPMCQRAVVP